MSKNLVFIGSYEFYANLFDKINAKSQTNSKNKVSINTLNRKINILTKYYETELEFDILASDSLIQLKNNALGVVIHSNVYPLNIDDSSIQSLDQDDLLKIAIFESNSLNNADDFYSKYNFDCVQMRSDDDDEEFDYVDDLLNSLFTHKWPTISRGTSQLDSNAQEFDDLLMNLSEMREQAAKLPTDERKDYAENVVKNFLKIIGADEHDLNSDFEVESDVE